MYESVNIGGEAEQKMDVVVNDRAVVWLRTSPVERYLNTWNTMLLSFTLLLAGQHADIWQKVVWTIIYQG